MTISAGTEFRTLCQSRRWQLGALFLLILASRLPFLDAGYGMNVDAWRVARAARDIAQSGEYCVSRFPGYPVHEIVCSWFWKGGPIVLNALSAIMSAVAATTFGAITQKLGCRQWWLAGTALAMTPIFFLSSVCAKDYVWALALVLVAFYCALSSKAVLAGMFLGLATGCRITSLAMALPLALIIFFQAGRGRSWRQCALFLLIAIGVAAIAFSPVWLRYGWTFLTFYEKHARPTWQTTLSRATVEIWGKVGLIALGGTGVWLLFLRANTFRANRFVLAAAGFGIILYSAAYLRLPDQAGYLLPVVPLLLLVIICVAPERAVQFLVLGLSCASFAEFSGGSIVPGPIVADRHERLQTMEQIRNFVAYSQTLPGRNIIVVGSWEPQIAVMAPQLANSRNHYNYLLSEAEVRTLLGNGQRIFYLPAIRSFNYDYNGVDLAAFGAIDLHAFFAAQNSDRR